MVIPPPDTGPFLARLEHLAGRVNDARANGQSVEILVATKGCSASTTRNVIAAMSEFGLQPIVGESRTQELIAKESAVADLPHRTDFIGSLQSNKVAATLGHVQAVQSVDRVGLVTELAKRTSGRTLDVYVQVNTSREPTKHGAMPEQVDEIVAETVSHPALLLRGFMTIGAHDRDERSVRASFADLREIRDRIIASNIPGTEQAVELSMGMSHDLETAIEEGSTMVRIGRAITGAR